jgi:Tol biopolymer transport system component
VKRLALAALLLALLVSHAGGASTATSAPGAIVFSSSRATDLWGEIYVRPVDGGPARNLSRSPANDREAVLAPDGRTIAFLSDRSGRDAVWSMRADGRALRRLSPTYASLAHLQWSPSGRALLYSVTRPDGSGTLMLLDLARRATTRLLSRALTSEFSPDGREIAVSRLDNKLRSSVAVIDVTGHVLWRADGFLPKWSHRGELAVTRPGQIALYSSAGRLQSRVPGSDPLWSPDGTTLAFTRAAGLFILSGGTAKAVLAAHGPNLPAPVSWAPDGKALIALTGPSYVLVGKDGTTRKLSWPFGMPVWSPDGAKAVIAGTSLALAPRGSLTAHTLAARTPGFCLVLYESPAWLPDGKTLLYVHTREGQSLRKLWTLNAGGQPRLLSASELSEEDPSWSPDGGSVLFKEGSPNTHAGGCDRTTDPALAVVKGENTPDVVTTPDPARGLVDTDPAWSPDGQQVAFVRTAFSESPHNGVYVVAASGGAPHRVSTEAKKAFFYARPTWSPDGKQLVYGTDLDGIHVVSAGGGTARSLGAGRVASWSPDGKLVAVSNGGGLAVVEPDGTDRRSLWPTETFERADRPAWSHDSRAIAVATAQGLVVARPPARGRLALRGALVGPIAWSPDGTRILFAASSTPTGLSRTFSLFSNDLFAVHPDGTHLQRLTRDDAAITGLDWRR